MNPVSLSSQCPNSCNFNGDCLGGKCRCFIGYGGHDCSKRELPYFLCDGGIFLRKVVLFGVITLLLSISGSCPGNCGEHGKCLGNGVCECDNGFTGIDCSTGKRSILLVC